MTLSDKIREFLDHDHYATIATVDPDGGPRQATIWYTLDGDGHHHQQPQRTPLAVEPAP